MLQARDKSVTKDIVRASLHCATLFFQIPFRPNDSLFTNAVHCEWDFSETGKCRILYDLIQLRCTVLVAQFRAAYTVRTNSAWLHCNSCVWLHCIRCLWLHCNAVSDCKRCLWLCLVSWKRCSTYFNRAQSLFNDFRPITEFEIKDGVLTGHIDFESSFEDMFELVCVQGDSLLQPVSSHSRQFVTVMISCFLKPFNHPNY